MKETVGFLQETYDRMYDAFSDQKEMMGMMLHMQKQTFESSLRESSSCKSVANLCKTLTNLQNLDDTLKLSQSGSVDVSEMTETASNSATSTNAILC
eukprot:11070634-Ditylum_brightwellii.AAC.1